MKLYLPGFNPEIVVLTPVPDVITLSGERVRDHVPDEGKPLSITLPVETVHVGFVIVPTTGAEGSAFTVRVNVVAAASHGEPSGLLVVTVIMTVFPASPETGV